MAGGSQEGRGRKSGGWLEVVRTWLKVVRGVAGGSQGGWLEVVRRVAGGSQEGGWR